MGITLILLSMFQTYKETKGVSNISLSLYDYDTFKVIVIRLDHLFDTLSLTYTNQSI